MYKYFTVTSLIGFQCGSVLKNLPASTGDPSLIPELGRSSGKGNGNPVQYSWLGNPKDRGAGELQSMRVTKESNTA